MIPRERYMQKIRPFMNTPVVKVFTGIRRCGKSVMLELVQAELRETGVTADQIIALNFESALDPRVRSMESMLNAIHEHKNRDSTGRLYLFFDEIQELPGWEKLINSLMVDTDADIYITGSNARLLSGELATYLAGRYVEIRIYPFSFAEAYTVLSNGESPITQEDAFKQYLLRGGFPFLYKYPFSDADANQYISDIFDSTILKDIAQRNNVRDIAQLRQQVLYFIANTGNTFSATSLVKYLKNQRRTISTETIYNYIEYYRSACLLHLVQRRDLAGKAILTTQEKIYLVDHGIREALYGNNQKDINQVLENIVYMELLRRDFEVTVGKSKNAEVDFCATKGAATLYVQVCYLLAADETVEREFAVLESIPDNYPKYVLSMDEIDRSRNGIIHKNIRNFLLGDFVR
ncbi:MAG TPA: ATP-binding protein [Treponemataceae bacterium]|nr:ATP-binding protein [Treponemataceae bacterium]